MIIEEILDQCLKDIRVQRLTAADCLKKYPKYANELKPLLETARTLQDSPDVKPSVAFKAKTRAQLARLAPPASAQRSAILLPRFSFVTVAAILLVILGLIGGMVYAASDSLPDSSLYPIKRGTEQVQAFFATEPESQARMHMVLAERRLAEAQALANKPDQSALAEQTIAEYNNQVNASLAAVPSDQTSAALLKQELTNRLTQQQDQLHTLDKKVSAPALENALGNLGKAKEKLNLVSSPQPTTAAPATAPRLISATPTPAPPIINTQTLPAATPPPENVSTPIPSPALPNATLPAPGVTIGAPTSVPGPPSGPPVVVPPVLPPPVKIPPVVPTVRLP